MTAAHKCQWCKGEVVYLASNGPGSTMVRVCEHCDGGLLDRMFNDDAKPEEGS